MDSLSAPIPLARPQRTVYRIATPEPDRYVRLRTPTVKYVRHGPIPQQQSGAALFFMNLLRMAFVSALLVACGQKPPAARLATQQASAVTTQIEKGPKDQVRAAEQQPEKLDCQAEQGISPNGDFGRKKLWDGYEVSVEGDPNDPDSGCSAVIYDRSGKVVYNTSGPDILLDPSTGLDIAGDGVPDVVLVNGANGNGGGGSWELEVVSLNPQPHLLFSFGGNFPIPAFSRDSRGRIVLWTGDRWLGELQNIYNIPNAEVHYQQRAYRFTDGKLTEVTPEYRAEIEPGLFVPSKHEVEDFKASDIASGQFDQSEAADILNLLLQQIFCRQFDRALALIHQAWPAQDQPKLFATLKQESKGWNCPECENAIASWR